MRAKILGAVAALLASIFLLTGTLTVWGQVQNQKRNDLRDFMRQKLEHSQRILEGITLEDYQLVAKNAVALRELSEDARWKVSPNINYFRLGAQFQVIADELAEKARQKNLDGATLAYMELTMSCVKCHKLVRDGRFVTYSEPSEKLLSLRGDPAKGAR